MSTAYIALGSNLGARESLIGEALAALAADGRVDVVAVSRLRETEPVGVGAQPRFLNGAARLETSLAPRELLDRLLDVERRLGRVRSPDDAHGPRTIDLDLLLYGSASVREPGLEVPHPRLHERRFVLEPLADLDPALEIPGRGTVQGLLAGLQSS